MATVRMKALKPMRLNTRMMRAGAEFDVSPRKGRVLRAIGKADYCAAATATHPSPEPMPQSASTSTQPTSAEISLADEYRKLTGDEPDGRWRERRLREEIDAFKAREAMENG